MQEHGKATAELSPPKANTREVLLPQGPNPDQEALDTESSEAWGHCGATVGSEGALWKLGCSLEGLSGNLMLQVLNEGIP